VTEHVLQPGSPEAAQVAHLFWLFLGITSAVYVAVVGALALALLRPRRGEDDLGAGEAPAPGDVLRTRSVGAAAALTLALLFVLLLASFRTGRILAAPPPSAPRLVVQVTGHQWWWQLTYHPGDPARTFDTANEIHVPVGVPVVLKLRSADVIHSFWVPSLQGKRDLIPGHVNELRFTASRAGVYAGQCAEFCGMQHARMQLRLVAEPGAQFAAWQAREREPAAPPRDALRARGQAVFTRQPCAFCHTVRGTDAGGRTAPDLTHLASRATLAAGTLPNTRGALAGWILDAPSSKPGTPMPPVDLPPDDLQALLAWLESLK
jgi:cytochrome c oxidase subunit 2